MLAISFENLLRSGRGRAVLELRASPPTQALHDAIHRACCEDQRWDAQGEEPRDAFLAEVIHASGDPAWHLDRLQVALSRPDACSDQVAAVLRRLTSGEVANNEALPPDPPESPELDPTPPVSRECTEAQARAWIGGHALCAQPAIRRLSDQARSSLAATPPESPAPIQALIRWLRVFQSHGFPLTPEPVLTLAAHPNDDVRWAALLVAEKTRHPLVREFAALVGDPSWPHAAHVAALVASNPGQDDAELLRLAWARVRDDEDDLHHFGHGLLRYHDTVPDAALSGILLEAFQLTPCSLCRRHFTERLLAEQAAPAWLLAELPWDADPHTRALTAP